MKFIIYKGILFLTILCGITQFLLIPGAFWNFLFPILPTLLILIYCLIQDYRNSLMLKYAVFLLLLLSLIDVGFYVISIRNVKPPNDPKELTIMTYNLLFSNKSPKLSLSIIKSVEPDILLFQELTHDWEKLLLNEFGDIYQFKATHPLKGAHGIGIFSKYKISNQSIINNSNKPFAQIAELSFNNKKVQFINTHLASPAGAVENKHDFFNLYSKNYSRRKKEVSEIMEKTLTLSNKYDCQILAGDLNTLRFEPIFKKIQINWQNSTPRRYDFSHCSFPNTNKSKPFITLDYIMARGKVKFIDTKTIQGGSSDHLAIVSKIMI